MFLYMNANLVLEINKCNCVTIINDIFIKGKT